MYNITKKDEIIEALVKGVKANAEANLANLDLEGFISKGLADQIRESVAKIQKNVISAIPAGIPVPKTSLYVTPSMNGGVVTTVKIKLTNRVKSVKKFAFEFVAVNGSNVVGTVLDFFLASYEQLIIDYMAQVNVDVINEILAEAGEKAGATVNVELTTELSNANKKIAYISDDSVVFVASTDRIFDVDDILVLQEPSELISEEAIADAKQQIVEDMAYAQSALTLVEKHGGRLIEYFANISRGVKAMTMIKKVTNRNIFRLVGNKDTMVYYNENDIFAILVRAEGIYEMVLSPFNVNTLEPVELDVLGMFQSDAVVLQDEETADTNEEV